MILKIFIIMCIIGSISSGFGGLLANFIKTKNNNTIAILFNLTAGIMTGIVCFDMIIECLDISNVFFTVICIIIGVVIVLFLDKFIDNLNMKKIYNTNKTAIMVMISMSFHNFIEGIAIGSSFIYSFSLGISLLIAIFLHDIPEGMVVGIAYKANKSNKNKILKNSALSGLFTGIGALCGSIAGSVNDFFVAFCLSIAAGAMLYIVACELIPNSNKFSNNRISNISYILGILLSVLIIYI